MIKKVKKSLQEAERMGQELLDKKYFKDEREWMRTKVVLDYIRGAIYWIEYDTDLTKRAKGLIDEENQNLGYWG